MATSQNPRVGIGLFVLTSDSKFLIGARLGSLGSATYGLPGGHLEFGETFERCAARELLEETGIEVDEREVRFLTATNQPDLEGRHYVTVFMGVRVDWEAEDLKEGRVAKILEAEKCGGWEWITWDEMRRWEESGKKLFRPLNDLFEQRPNFKINECL